MCKILGAALILIPFGFFIRSVVRDIGFKGMIVVIGGTILIIACVAVGTYLLSRDC